MRIVNGIKELNGDITSSFRGSSSGRNHHFAYLSFWLIVLPAGSVFVLETTVENKWIILQIAQFEYVFEETFRYFQVVDALLMWNVVWIVRHCALVAATFVSLIKPITEEKIACWYQLRKGKRFDGREMKNLSTFRDQQGICDVKNCLED